MSGEGNRKGCAPHPTLSHKCQPPSTCSTARIPVQAQNGWACVVPLHLSFPKVTLASFASRGVSIGKIPEVIYTSDSCQSRSSHVPASLTDGFVCNLRHVTKKKKEAGDMT